MSIEKSKPPFVWYGGFAFPGENIRSVFIGTKEFLALNDSLGDRMCEWLNGHVENNPESQQIAKAAAIFIEQVTHYHPQELIDYKLELEDQFRGLPEAPFPIDWIPPFGS